MRKALEYSKKLEEVGLSRQQAEAHLGILEEIVEDEMATKADIQALDSKMTNAMQALESRMTTSLKALDSKMDNGFKELEYKITIRLGIMFTVGVGALATLIKLG